MLMLNYASEELKKEAKYRRIYHALKKSSYFLITAAVLAAAIIFAAGTLLRNELVYLEKEKNSYVGSFAEQNSKIKEINSKIKDAEDIRRGSASLMDDIKILASDKLNGIKFISLKIEASSKNITVFGIAGTREDLILYKDKLQNNTAYKDLKFITPNLTQKTDINFNFETKLSTE